MSTHRDDLDLLLSLQDRVLETPPASPSAQYSGYLSDDGSPKRVGQVDMSVFRNAVQDCLDYEPETCKKAPKSKGSNDADVEKFSGLRIRKQLVGDTLSGCWATVGVLTEKGERRTSSMGKNYCIWKIGCLDENTLSVFLFGTAYQKHCKEEVGTVFALFNSGARKDNSKIGCSLSVYNATQMLKMGTSVDHGVCKGNGCTIVINRSRGIYCKYHKSKASEKYSNSRTELKGGNLRMSFRDHLKSEGIYMVDPQTHKKNIAKPKQILSVEGLKKALSNAGKVTTNTYSQGIRFLTEIAGKMDPKSTPNQPQNSSQKRRSASSAAGQENAKRIKIEQRQPATQKTEQQVGEKMIELDFVSSDEEI